jgi:anti-anti-sigma factor
MHGSCGDVHVLRYAGDIRYPLASSVQHFVRDELDGVAIAELVFDLTATRIIDSTNLGLIARIGQEVQARGGEVLIVAPAGPVREVLSSMGFEQVFPLCERLPVLPAGEQISEHQDGPEDRARLMLAAHRTLMNLDPANEARFREVAALLERELEVTPSRPPSL